MPKQLTSQIIEAAIKGFQSQKAEIDSQIAELRSMLDSRRTKSAVVPSEDGRPRRKFSRAARAKMAAAQKARWAGIKQGSAPTQTDSAKPKKRKLSAAGRKAISVAAKKRWASKKAASKQAA